MNTHYDEICRLAESPNGTQVWVYVDKAWFLVNSVKWDTETHYVVNDGIHVEYRKAFALGETIQYKSKYSEKWIGAKTPSWGKDVKYRIRPDEWYEHIEEPVICWVSATDKNEREFIRLIISHGERGFQTKMNDYWAYATPVTSEDLKERR